MKNNKSADLFSLKDDLTGHPLADIVVLAVDAMQVASRKEDRAGAACTAQHVFFAVMWPITGNVGHVPNATRSGALRAVDAAIVAAEATVAQGGSGFCRAFREIAAL